MKKSISFFFVVLSLSCDKVLELPDNRLFIGKEDLLNNRALLESHFLSVYDDLYYLFNGQTGLSVGTNLSVHVGAFADEFREATSIVYPSSRNSFANTYYSNELSSSVDFFTPYYKLIVRCNTIIDQFLKQDDDNLAQYRSELKAIRAIIYLYLIQIYREVPLLIHSDLQTNLKTARGTRASILEFCSKELEETYAVLDDSRRNVAGVTIGQHYTERINKDIVAYYLSAAYLLSKDYSNSIKYSRLLVERFPFNSNFDKKFEIASTENIWLLNPSVSNDTYMHNNPNASFLNYTLYNALDPFSSGIRPFALSTTLVDGICYTDKRRIHYVDSVLHNNQWYFLPNKYKVGGILDMNYLKNQKEQFVIVRLPMVYFNLMEAYYQNNQKAEAIAFFNEMGRINYTDYVDVTDVMLEDIVQERFKELFAENGDRWFTLKRTGLVDKVMTEYLPLKNNNAEPWNPEKMLYLPIPFEATNLNPNL